MVVLEHTRESTRVLIRRYTGDHGDKSAVRSMVSSHQHITSIIALHQDTQASAFCYLLSRT